MQRALEDRAGIAYCLFGLGRLALDRGNVEGALARLDEGLDLFKQMGDRRYTAIVFTAYARALLAAGRSEQGLNDLAKGLAMRKESGDRQGLVESLEAVAGALLACAAVTPLTLVQVLGGAEARREAMGAPMPVVERPDYKRNVAELRSRITEAEVFDEAWLAGRALSATAPEKVLELAWNALGQALPRG